MADKNIRFKDADGNKLYPQTKSSLVLAANGTDNLGTVEVGAQVNVLEKVKVNGVEQTITTKAVDLSVPVPYDASTAVNGYITKAILDTQIEAAKLMKREIVSALPTSGQKENVIYMVPKATAQTQNVYDEYLWIAATSSWEKIGSTEIDLSQYAPLASPAFTGTPTAPTPSAGDNSTKIATTAFVASSMISYEEI